MIKRCVSAICLSVICCSTTLAVEKDFASVETALANYVAQPDPSHSWKLVQSAKLGNSEYLEIKLTSQTWRDITWKHQLFLIKPSQIDRECTHGLLFITGGSWRPEMDEDDFRQRIPREAVLFASVAEQLKTPIAILLQVPFQPIFEDKYEDAIIAYTFDEYLKSGDPEWPLLLPMVKSAVRSMDIVQTACEQEWELTIETFTVTGASKRGWTTWLTGAVEPRATAIAPIVIDVLDMNRQMRHQKLAWGDLSNKIDDYSRRGLIEKLDTPSGRQLLKIVDPFSYRKALTQPKLIIIGTNDRYWPVDSLNLYWEQLPGQKHILYVPNQGHGVKDLVRLISTLSEFHRRTKEGKVLPQLKWDFEHNGKSVNLTASSDEPLKTFRVWTASAATRDFRDAEWTDQIVAAEGEEYQRSLEIPEQGYLAAFAEAVYPAVPSPFFLSTNVVVLDTLGIANTLPR